MYPLHHVRTEDGRESLTIFMPSGPPIVATGDHPHFAALLEGAKNDVDPEDLRNLSDLSSAVAQHFEALSERVSVANGRVYFDGDEIDSTVTKQIVRCLDDPSIGDWKPLVLFMENVAANPNAHSREQLFDWLRDRDFTITSNGCFIAYKGVNARNEGAEDSYPYQSSSSGVAIVDGERFTGAIPNGVGATVEMPRGDVQHDPSHGCSTGLHVGTYTYAQDYARAALLTVSVNPRDVVSVPTDCNAEKMRVCRYVVSDDEPTPPEDSAAIAYSDEDVDGAPERIEVDGKTYEVVAERLPLRGEIYLYQSASASVVATAVSDHGTRGSDAPKKILWEVGPRRLYSKPFDSWDDSVLNAYFSSDYYAKTGEVRAPSVGELYLYQEGTYVEQVGRAAIDYSLDRLRAPIMEPTTPQHGDEFVDEDGDVWFYLDCPKAESDRQKGPRWADAAGRTQEEFISAHAHCFV